MLKGKDFHPTYSTGFREPCDFFIEGLMNSIQFDLGLGYFSSTGFKSLAIGFASFLQNGGSMRFIINDKLYEKDKNAILEGLKEEPNKDYEKRLLEDLKELSKTLSKRDTHFFNCLSWLISSDRLQIIAVKPKKNKVGIVHHKFGIFTDEEGNQAAFNGSVNFSQYAFDKNVESIWSEYSWAEGTIAEQRISEMISLFNNTWDGKSEATRIIPIAEVKTAMLKYFPKKKLIELAEDECVLIEQLIKAYKKLGQRPEKAIEALENLKKETSSNKINLPQQPTQKWRHQDEAITKFLDTEKGVLNMATGTGKTRTALRICQNLIDNDSISTIIISCDGNDLLNQWYKELLNLIVSKGLSWSILKQYGGTHESDRFRVNPNKKILLTSRLQLHLAITNLEKNDANKLILIHDEVHKLGSEGNRNKLSELSDNIKYRLGLSATPEREYDSEGTQFIKDHIGPIIFEFTLEDAIKRGILSPFNYYPVNYKLTSEDRARLQNVFKRKAVRQKEGNPMTEDEIRNEIARVYKTAEGKIPSFKQFISENTSLLKKCIIFVETKEFGERILEIVHKHRSDFHTYFGGDDSNILSKFESGEIECLLTCHRLSEGIDIPSLQNVILISSAKVKLETIQRIGRCLRIDPKNEKKVANVVDFIRENDKQDGKLNTDEERLEFLRNLSTIRPKDV